ncbi:sorting nexin-17-like [Panonychus citri]|uniref:sorting nexin-17-like n=1 Tax=Panonychus citri TaxID=50023 RepID=UPI002306DF41|nr:sorting nexin-17-like [Panonychus citri]
MHFSIPETQELKDSKQGQTFIAYSIHANGSFHCLLRYKQLFNFHDQLKKQFGSNSLPYFPPKRLLPLNQTQIEERRIQLEKYLQIISQDDRISKSDYFNSFLLHAQRETQNIAPEEITLDIYLMNWESIQVKTLKTDKSSILLETACRSIKLAPEMVNYFSLFIVRQEEANFIILRRLLDFESPYLTLKSFNVNCNHHRIVIRKNYWDTSFDDILMEDKVSFNLLYSQTIIDIERGWIKVNKEVEKQLSNLKSKGSKRELIELARTLKFYGYIQFEPCICDYPAPNTSVIVNAGSKELVINTICSSNKPIEYVFRVTRIRCWRLTTCINDEMKIELNSTNSKQLMRFELSFEYLFNKDCLKWITLKSDQQSILMSMCLRAMVEELLMKRKGINGKDNGIISANFSRSTINKDSYQYLKRDGTSQSINLAKSISTDNFTNGSSNQRMRRSQSLNGVIRVRPLVANDAFDGIGDDDL